MSSLISHELLRLRRSGHWWIISCILVAAILILYIPLVQHHSEEVERQGTGSWETHTQQKILEKKARPLPPGARDTKADRENEASIRKLQTALDHRINPYEANALIFVRKFMETGCEFLFPILVFFIVVNILSEEYRKHTIIVLLTNSGSRLRILANKVLATVLSISLFLSLATIFSFLVSGFFFGYGGWDKEVVVNSISGSGISAPYATQLAPNVLVTIASVGLTGLSCLTMAMLGFFTSILFRNPVLNACIFFIITIVCPMMFKKLMGVWEGFTYLPFIHFSLPNYLSRPQTFFPDMSISFSLLILGLWALLFLAIVGVVFYRQDLYSSK